MTRAITKRQRSLSTAKVLGALLVVLGIANAVAGVIIGNRITQPTLDAYGGRVTEISPTGWGVIGNSIAIGLILVVAGSVVVAFANALAPDADEVAYPAQAAIAQPSPAPPERA